MICPSCKRELPPDSKFCQYCGLSLSTPSSVNEEPRSPIKKKPKKWGIITCIVLVLVLALAGGYWGTYSSAKHAAVEHNYSKAKQLLLIPSLTSMHDPYLMAYVDAGQRYAQKDYTGAKSSFESLNGYLDSSEMEKKSAYYEALDQLTAGKLSGYKAIASMAKENYPLAVNGLESAKKQAYDQAVSLYRRGENYAARNFFLELSGYERSSDYLTLIRQSSYTDLKKLIGFENANDIILNNFSNQFLESTWKTSDGKYYFTLSQDKNGSYLSDFNLPCMYHADSSFSIINGIFSQFVYNQGTTALERLSNSRDKTVNVFRFTILTADKIYIYCYKDESMFLLYRQ